MARQKTEREGVLEYEYYQIARRYGQHPKKVYAILDYLNPDSQYFGNWHGSYEAVTGKPISRAGAYFARKTLGWDPMVKDIIEVTNTGKLPRLHALRSIIDGTYKKKVVTKDRHGNIITTVESTPSANEIRAVIDVLNKMDGTYVKEEAKKSVYTEELRKLARDSRPKGVD